MTTPTMNAALASVRVRLEETTAEQWTDAAIKEWINEGCRDISLKAEWKRAGPTNVSFSAGTATGSAPSTMIRLESAEYQITGQSSIYPLEIREWNEMTLIWGTTRGSDQSIPGFVTARGYPGAFTLYLFPIPSSAGNLIVNYTQLSTDTDTTTPIDCPEGWQQVVFDYAEYKALRRARDPRWQEAKATYEENLAYLMDLTRTFHNQPGVNTFTQDEFIMQYVTGLY